ncbi:RNA polymerase sigma-70 factor [Fulvivirgaceae bacterium BMA10]|uniref:RNA polymerase sigma-70 factor n=1 Tax=Splendidivirga corallicola TaxID=3051826 RepID=A0ABT8KS58_9BACT|nr:RNA polymerase sigma-70 factor [Fulvivirgaceae bacterium BMA10]
MNVYSDKTLLSSIRQNDQKALELLYEKYYHSLCDFAFNFVRSIEISEEVVSDVFLNIWLKRAEINITSNFKSYLFISVKNQSLNYLSKSKVKFEDLEILDKTGHISEKSAHAKIYFTEFEKEIEQILQELPPQRRIIFKLNRIEGLKYMEIAKILSISVNTVQKQMTEAVKFLANYQPYFKATWSNCLFVLSYIHLMLFE